ncbi:MAG: glycoside hydrolase family 31 protein [Verrucomicrobiota bacterium]
MKPHSEPGVRSDTPPRRQTNSPILSPSLPLLAWLTGLLLMVTTARAAPNEKSEFAVSGSDAAFTIKGVALTNPTPIEFDPDVVLPPAWAFGVLHGYYTNQAGILRNLKLLEAGDFPVDAVWVDSAFWDLTTKGPEGYLDFKGDRKAFPDLRQLTRELEKRDIRFGIWVWDRILDANPEAFNEFASHDFFKPGEIVSNGWHNLGLQSVGRSVDFSNPAAAALWSKKLRPFLNQGVDFFKIDADPTLDYVRTHFELSQQFGRHTRGRGFVLSHCNRDSPQAIRHYPAAWTGDAEASWHQVNYPDTQRWILGGLRQQIEMVANPTWRHYAYPFLANDTGGFHARSLQGAAAEELYIRWAQFSAFGSIMQVFGAPIVPEQNAPFGWPAHVQENFRTYAHLRLRLFPYLYTHAMLTRLTGQKVIQGEVEHRFQFRFGDAFLVAPVHEPGATDRTVWLPPSKRWIDYWTGQSYDGGQEITVPAPLEHLPLLVRAGAIIPMRDYAPGVLRGNNATLTLDVYPEGSTKESEFTLYEDDGASNDYLTNSFASTKITCQPGAQSVNLRIAPIQGDYRGKLKQRQWKLEMHLASKPTAVSLNGKSVAWTYDATKKVLHVAWKAATANPNEIVLSRGTGGL